MTNKDEIKESLRIRDKTEMGVTPVDHYGNPIGPDDVDPTLIGLDWPDLESAGNPGLMHARIAEEWDALSPDERAEWVDRAIRFSEGMNDRASAERLRQNYQLIVNSKFDDIGESAADLGDCRQLWDQCDLS